MIVLFSSIKNLNLVCLPFLTGKNPSKTNLSLGKPEFTSAGIKAVAPGRQSISISFSTHALTKRKPGSEIAGVPASLIKAMLTPDFNFSIILSSTLCSLCI